VAGNWAFVLHAVALSRRHPSERKAASLFG